MPAKLRKPRTNPYVRAYCLLPARKVENVRLVDPSNRIPLKRGDRMSHTLATEKGSGMCAINYLNGSLRFAFLGPFQRVGVPGIDVEMLVHRKKKESFIGITLSPKTAAALRKILAELPE